MIGQCPTCGGPLAEGDCLICKYGLGDKVATTQTALHPAESPTAMSDSTTQQLATLPQAKRSPVLGYVPMSPEELARQQQERADYWPKREAAQREQKATSDHGSLNPWMICPHCQTKGTVRTRDVKKKKGISGAKATAALMTGGWSLFATGLSRKEKLTQAHCENCGSDWLF